MVQGVSDYYHGSRILAGFAEPVGLSVDKLNFVVSQVLALLLASLFRTRLHPSKVNANTRHLLGLSLGLIMGYFCFGIQAIHIAALPTSCYIVMKTTNPKIMQKVVLAMALTYLSVIHIHRQIYDYGSPNLDITGPLMVITQKVTSLAFNLHDGLTKTSDELTPNQKIYVVTKTPTALEFYSFVLHFPTLMAGPALFYNDYMEWIRGTNFAAINEATGSITTGEINTKAPSPLRAVLKNVTIAATCAVLFVKFLPAFPIKRAKDSDFIENTSISQKLLYLYISTALVRAKYYFAWAVADAICNNAGIGYNGLDRNGAPKWDKFTNVNILKFELATNLKESIEAWNLGTNRWLRMVVYERVKKHQLILTYSLSALWHGFYPGYYLTFANGALFTYASRITRKTVRNYFLANAETKLFYDGITFVVTRILMAYMVFTFVLLEFWPCIRIYMHMYWFLHVIGLVLIFVVPKIFRKTDLNATKNGIAQALSQAKPLTNGVGRHYD